MLPYASFLHGNHRRWELRTAPESNNCGGQKTDPPERDVCQTVVVTNGQLDTIFQLLGSGKGFKERNRSSWSSIGILHWHWHVEFIPARFGGGSGHKSMLHAFVSFCCMIVAACRRASMPRMQYSIMPDNKCQLKNATGSRVSLDPPERPVSFWQCSNVLQSTDTATVPDTLVLLLWSIGMSNSCIDIKQSFEAPRWSDFCKCWSNLLRW